MADRKISTERAREIGRLGKQASPWSREPSSCTEKAHKTFHKHSRLHLIKGIVEKSKDKV